MLEGINYLHAKFQINIFRNKKVIKLLELWTLWTKKRKTRSKDLKSCEKNKRAVELFQSKTLVYYLNTQAD